MTERIVSGLVDQIIRDMQEAPTIERLDFISAHADRHIRALSAKDWRLINSAYDRRRAYLEGKE